MKRIFTLLLLSGITGFSFSQVTSTVLIEEDFGTSVNPDLSSSTFLNRSSNNGFDGNEGVANLELFNFTNPTINYVGDISQESDSILIEFKLDKQTMFGGQVINFDNTIEIQTFNSVFANYNGVSLQGNQSIQFLTQNEFTVTDSSSFWSLKKQVVTIPTSQLSIIDFLSIQNPINANSITGSYSGNDGFDVASQFCNAEFPGDIDCEGTVGEQLSGNQSDFIKIDDIKITAYNSDVTGINNDINSEKTIVASYNLLGLPVNKETKKEVIILKYSDGSSERIINY